MNIVTTNYAGLMVIEPKIFEDERGYFYESYNAIALEAATGFDNKFIQDNQARSVKNVLRGLHYQDTPYAQTKLIRVLEGAIWDVVVDLRKESETYGQWYGVLLSAENKIQFLIPKGFAHGYSVLSDTAEVFYKCDEFYNKQSEGGIFYNDPTLNIDWKIDISDAIVSEKDLNLPMLADSVHNF